MADAGALLAEAIDSLGAQERAAFGAAFEARAAELGLTYLAPDGPRPIPVAFPPVVEPRDRTRQRSALARSIVEALAGVARSVLDGLAGSDTREALLAELAPLEREIVERTYRDLRYLPTVRVDIFVTAEGLDRVLEVNATIPAMQGYSDIAARAFLEVAAERLAGRSPAEARSRAAALLVRSGSNADDLLESILAAHRAYGGTATHPRIALVHRASDSQLGELRYLASRFTERGYPTQTAVASEVTLEDGRVAVGEFRPDFVYRHVFARRVEPSWPMAAVLRAPLVHRLGNPVDPHLEQKGMLGELSAAAQDAELGARLGLSPAHAALVRTHVPWTRRLVPGAARLAGGEPIAELVAWVQANPHRLVVKRSWDFGGKGVFLGAEHGDEGSLGRAKERFGAPLAWTELVAACADERGWVVQERVPLSARRLYIAAGGSVAPRDVFIDLSAYTSLGLSPAPEGGVCRASGSPIVNIQSGGGVVPLLSSEVAAELLG